MSLKAKRNKSAMWAAILVLFLGSFAVCIAQEEGPDDAKEIAVPDYVMKEVVRRTLAWYYKPSRVSKVVYLADIRIRKEWLPVITNIRFELVSLEDLRKEGRRVHFFTAAEVDRTGYQVAFAFGDPECEYSGELWSFRVSRKKVRLWPSRGGVGAGCGQSSSAKHETLKANDAT